MRADQPWEGWRLEIFGTVLFDSEEQIFKMWYVGESFEDFPDYAVLYATSTDGVNWQKPLVGTVESKRGGRHNAVAEGYLLASVIKDEADLDPRRRYKMICWRQKHPWGPQTMISPDGLHWSQVSEKPICASADVITGFYDRSRQLYVAFPKLNTVVNGIERRCFGITTSRDFASWTPSQLVLVPDARDDCGSLARIEQVRPILDRPDAPSLMRTEFYGMGAYQAESCIVGFPWVLTINNNARWGNHEGPQEIQLAVSRDLVHWERPFRTPVIEIGQLDQWDASYHTCAASAIRVGDEVWLYYAGANYTHGSPVVYREKFDDGKTTGRGTKQTSSIGLVTWKLDRFVSVDASAEGGTLTTVPITFQGNRLEINAATKQSGVVTVELLDAAGRPIEGLAFSDAFRGDSIHHVVTFSENTDVSTLQNRPISLRFRLTNAELYSFAFRGS
ncbi:MAG: hypothetical protein IT427_00275 [Pirellulales bacterium]|nr:hypothetical protein [Pirellulales bacterium]